MRTIITSMSMLRIGLVLAVLTVAVAATQIVKQPDRITITYEAKTKWPPEALRMMPSLAERQTLYRFTLDIDGDRSRYVKTGAFLITPRLPGEREPMGRMAIYKDLGQGLWFKTSARYETGKGYARTIAAENHRMHYDWQATGRDSAILGISCLEMRSRTTTVWYAPEIPIPDGPHNGAFGLPGLVLVLSNESGVWYAVDIAFDGPPVEFPTDVEWVAEERTIELGYDALGRLTLADGVINLTADSPVGQWLEFD